MRWTNSTVGCQCTVSNLCRTGGHAQERIQTRLLHTPELEQGGPRHPEQRRTAAALTLDKARPMCSQERPIRLSFHRELHLAQCHRARAAPLLWLCKRMLKSVGRARPSKFVVDLKMRFTNVNQRTARCCISSSPLQRHRCQVFSNVRLPAQLTRGLVCPLVWQTTVAYLL